MIALTIPLPVKKRFAVLPFAACIEYINKAICVCCVTDTTDTLLCFPFSEMYVLVFFLMCVCRRACARTCKCVGLYASAVFCVFQSKVLNFLSPIE